MGSIGNGIARQRQIAGMTQRELANKLQMTPQQLSQYETGTRTPRYSTLKRIAIAIGCNIEDISSPYIVLPRKTDDFTKKEETDQPTFEDLLLFNFHSLNANGKTKVVEYSEDMMQIPAYRLHAPAENPATERNGNNEPIQEE